MNVFEKCLSVLQGTDVLTEAKSYSKIESMGKIYTKPFTYSIKRLIDQETINNITAICVCDNGELWVTEDKDPTTSKRWNEYSTSVSKRLPKYTSNSNSKGDDIVAKRLRDREGK